MNQCTQKFHLFLRFVIPCNVYLKLSLVLNNNFNQRQNFFILTMTSRINLDIFLIKQISICNHMFLKLIFPKITQKIRNLALLLYIFFVSQDIGEDETNWLVKASTKEELLKLSDAISKIWEDLYAIELTVTRQPTVLPILDSYVLV